MLSPYFGEFLVAPVPLELSLNVCSYRCAYCFANLSQPARQAQPAAIMRLLRDYPQRTTLTARLLQAGYPTLVSNRDDIFAPSNWREGEPILRAMTELGLPLAFQTKGGPAALDALTWLRPACWYISVATLDDALRARVEPQAPSIGDRLDLIAALRAAGHRVVVGVAPCVAEWLPDAGALARTLAQAGVEGLWVARLHLNYRQARRLTARERAALTEPLLARAGRRTLTATDWDTLARVYDAAADAGLPVYSYGLPAPTRFWEPYRATYPATFPILADFVDHAFACREPGEVLTFADFAAVLAADLPEGTLGLDSYLGATAHQVWRDRVVPPQMTYRDLLRIIWSEVRVPTCPARLDCFAWLGRRAAQGWTQVTDTAGLPLLVFTPEGQADVWIDEDAAVGRVVGRAKQPT